MTKWTVRPQRNASSETINSVVLLQGEEYQGKEVTQRLTLVSPWGIRLLTTDKDGSLHSLEIEDKGHARALIHALEMLLEEK